MHQFRIPSDRRWRNLRLAKAGETTDAPTANNASRAVSGNATNFDSGPAPQISPDDITALFEQVADAVGDLEERRSGSLKELQEVAIQLAVAVAAKITRNSIEQHQQAVTELVTEAIGKLTGEGPVTICLNPMDLELLESQLGNAPPPWKSSRSVQFQPRVEMPRGNCKAETDEFGVLFDWKEQLDEIYESLLKGIDDAEVERRAAATTSSGIQRFPNRREIA